MARREARGTFGWLWLALAAAGCAAPPPPATTAPPRAVVQRAAEPAPEPVAAPSAPPPPAPREEVAEQPSTPRPVQPELLRACSAPRAVVVHKAARVLELRCGDDVAARYPISLGFAPRGAKRAEGDGRTPEGEYFISAKFPSRFHRSLQLAYPNADDAARGLAEGRITQRQHAAIMGALRSCRSPPQNTPLGSLLQVHGAGGGPEYGDWTLGCVAVDDDAIERVYAFHEPGCHPDGRPKTPVRLLP